MRLWFNSIASLLRFPGQDDASILGILRAAVARSASIGIGTVDGAARPSWLSGHVLDLEPDALVISRPFEGANRRELVVGEVLQRTGSYAILWFIAGSAYLIGLLVIHVLVPRLEPVKMEDIAEAEAK